MKRLSFLVIPIVVLLFLAPITSAYAQKTTATTDTLIAYQHHKIGDSLLKARNFDASIENFEKARLIYEKAEAWGRVVNCYNQLCRNYRRDHKYDIALKIVNMALKICDKKLEKKTSGKSRCI